MAAARPGWAWALRLSLGLALALGPGPGRAGQVPLLAWSTHGSLWPPPREAPAGRVLSGGQLGALLSPALRGGPRTLLLFLQEQLSLEDFTAFGGAFGNKAESAFPNLERALAGAGSALVLPAVGEGAGGALPPTLARALGVAPLRLDGAALRQLRLNASRPALLLPRLPHAARSSLMTPKEALTSNDEILGQVLSALEEEAVPYTAIFTALRPSRVLREAGGAPAGGRGRALLGRGEEVGEEPPAPPLRWPPTGPPRILLWARNLSVSFRGEQRDLTPRTFGGGASVDLGGSSWDPQEARLVLKYGGVFGGTLSITLVLRQAWFPVSGRPWAWLDEVGVSLGGGGPPARFLGRGGAAPTPLGWRCGELGAPGPFLSPPDPPGAAREWGLLLRDVQVQAFNVSGGSFGGASDCAAFFSGGAWLGLLPGGLLLGALALGGGLLLRLRPPDRFDPPRAAPLPLPPAD